MYKLPRSTTIEESSTVENPYIEHGTAYTFMTDQNVEWQLSLLSINDSLSFPGLTLEPLYSANKSVGYLLYNDQGKFVELSF